MEKKANNGKFSNVQVGDIIIYLKKGISHALGIIQNWSEDKQDLGFSSFDGASYFPLSRWNDCDTYADDVLQYIVRPLANIGIADLLSPHWKRNMKNKGRYKIIYDGEEPNTVELTVAEVSKLLGYDVKIVQ